MRENPARLSGYCAKSGARAVSLARLFTSCATTDDIAGKITAIQQATRGSVSANQSIQATIVEVQHSAQRIRDAMDAQAQTVTSITAAVDETALAADSMSSTIASIRNDSGMVAGEISVLSEEFSRMGERLQSLEKAASEFSRRVA